MFTYWTDDTPEARVFSFHLVWLFYEAVQGGADTNELLNKHLRSAAPSLVVSDRNITPEFAGLVQRMLSKKPDSRPTSMEKFLREFQTMKIYKQAPQVAGQEPAEDDDN